MVYKKLFKVNKIIIASCILTLTIMGFFFLGFSFPNTPNNISIGQKAFVSFYDLNGGNQNEILNDQALFFDTKPIFLPTKWNANEKQILNKVDDSSLFQDLLPETTLYPYKTLSQINYPELSTLLSLDILNKKLIHPFEGMNQDRPVFSSTHIPKAHIIIKNFNKSDIIEAYEINHENTLLQEIFWAPLEFLATIDESGLIMPLLISQSSGVEDIDNFFKNFVSTPLLKLTHLPIGYYKIAINP